MPITKTQRWLDLIAFLAGRRYPVAIDAVMDGVPDYARRWGDDDHSARPSVRRTFERDKDELRVLGIQIDTVPLGPRTAEQGYRLDTRKLYLPVIRLLRRQQAEEEDGDRVGSIARRPATSSEFVVAQEDAAAALEGLLHTGALPGSPLSDAARSAYRKLTFDLDPEVLPGTPVVFAPPRHGVGVADRLRTLSDALTRRKRVRFRYRGIEREAFTERDVEPWGLMYRRGCWYVVGHDALRDAVRTFRVSRMGDLALNLVKPRVPDFDVPTEFDLHAYACREAWEVGPEGERPSPARVRFRSPVSLWAERNRYGRLIEDLEDGGSIRSFEVLDRHAFLCWLLTLEDGAEIQLPAEWRADLRNLARRVERLHASRETEGTSGA